MPKTFKYTNNQNQLIFQCQLNSEQCLGITKTGNRCNRRCVSPFDFCHTHLKYKYNLIIKPSLIPNSGKGLFAYDNKKQENEIVFPNKSLICEYRGELLPRTVIDQRYNQYTAPYAVQISNQYVIDPACKRGIGAFINTNNANQLNARFSVNMRNRTVSIKATKNIRNGQEIYLAYGNDYNLNEGTHHITY
jgi:hypothetical protein